MTQALGCYVGKFRMLFLRLFWGLSGVRKRVVSKRVVLADAPPERNFKTGTRVRLPKPPFYETALSSPSEPSWWLTQGVVSKRVVLADVPPERNFKTGTRVRSPKPPFYETALLSPSEPFWWLTQGVVSKRVVSADAPPERKPERGYVP